LVKAKAGGRAIEVIRATHELAGGPGERHLDFTRRATYSPALRGIDYVFLMRPPALTGVDEIFGPLLEAMVREGVGGVVFLSVYGAEGNRFVPHHGIEGAIRDSGLDYALLRPTYFMQNLTTTLAEQTRSGRIELPAGRATFNWIDAADIGATAAHFLQHLAPDERTELTLATDEVYSYGEVAGMIREITGKDVRYRSVSPLRFVYRAWRRGDSPGEAATVAAIHFAQRFQSSVEGGREWMQLLGRPARTLPEFIDEHRDVFGGGGARV
jgi:uncharacterized protein YbjT (DUF2867 family)